MVNTPPVVYTTVLDPDRFPRIGGSPGWTFEPDDLRDLEFRVDSGVGSEPVLTGAGGYFVESPTPTKSRMVL